jgi:hypothetical protein
MSHHGIRDTNTPKKRYISLFFFYTNVLKRPIENKKSEMLKSADALANAKTL